MPERDQQIEALKAEVELYRAALRTMRKAAHDGATTSSKEPRLVYRTTLLGLIASIDRLLKL